MATIRYDEQVCAHSVCVREQRPIRSTGEQQQLSVGVAALLSRLHQVTFAGEWLVRLSRRPRRFVVDHAGDREPFDRRTQHANCRHSAHRAGLVLVHRKHDPETIPGLPANR